MSLSGVLKFILGFFLAIVILAGGSVAAALYFVTKLTALPERPTFANDTPAVETTEGAGSGGSQQSQAASTASKPQTRELEPGAYLARVTWPDGLILRDRPSYDANSIGGIEFNRTIVVVESTDDKEWEKIRVEGGNQVGWVKGGNTEPMD